MHASNSCGQLPSWVVVLSKQLSLSELCGGLNDSWLTLTRFRRQHPAKFCACCAGLAIVGHAVPGTLVSLSVLVGTLIWQFVNHNEAIRKAWTVLLAQAPHGSRPSIAQQPSGTLTAAEDGAAKETTHSQEGATFENSTSTEESSSEVKQEQQPNSEDPFKEANQIICTEIRKPDTFLGEEQHNKAVIELVFKNTSKASQEKLPHEPCKLKPHKYSTEKDTKQEPVCSLNRDSVGSVPSFEYSIHSNVCHADQDNYTTSDLATMSLVSPLNLTGEQSGNVFHPAEAPFTNMDEAHGQMVNNSQLSGSSPNIKSNVSKYGPIISEGCIIHYAEITELTPNIHLPSNYAGSTIEGVSEMQHYVDGSEIGAAAKENDSYCVTSTEAFSRHGHSYLSVGDSLLLSTAPDLSELLSSALEEVPPLCSPAADPEQLPSSAEESPDTHSIPQQNTPSESKMDKASTQTCETDEEDNAEGFEVLQQEELQQMEVEMAIFNQSQSNTVSPGNASTGFLSHLLR